MKLNRLWKQFNWRFLLVRILVNAIALAITVALVPKIHFVDASFRNWLLMAIMLGVLNALVKPLLQFLTLQFIFVTFGLVLVIVNAMILMLLSLLFPNQFAVDSLLWALVGGLVLGLLSSFLESLLGLTMPLVADEPAELRQQVQAKARRVDWNAASDGEAEEHPQGMESVAPDSRSRGAGPDVATPGPGATSAPVAVPEPDAEPDAEPVPGDSALAAEAPATAEPVTSAETEAADEIQNETEEAQS